MIHHLRNLSVKASLTLVLAVFSIFLITIAWLGYASSSKVRKPWQYCIK